MLCFWGVLCPPFVLLKKVYIFTPTLKLLNMKFNLNSQQQDAILYAVTYTLANKDDAMMSTQNLNSLYDVLDMIKIEEDKRYGLYSGTHEGL
jgi:hypothetical protein